ncbi:DNA methyltransferase [Pseudomonas sp. CAU 1711]|uniref:TRM11 family SAM-dependent methyltransferase n=1 Tax=Pseudomonas sp. CAU 1711 TaxID=3140356 RepID=UPI003260931C
MDSRSWMLLEQEDPRWRLPDDLRRRDPFAARDCGWVEQMRPFIRQFSRPGERVLDPFCGFASTLLAAHLEERAGLGYEIDPARAELARERLARHGAMAQRVVAADILREPPQGGIDLCLTNIPYFGCGWASGDPDQLYASADYAGYLQRLGERLRLIRQLLAPGRYCIVMAENPQLGGQMLPLAWDVARLLAGQLQLCEERVLLYPKPVEALAPMSCHSDRSHEYALILRKQAEAPAPEAGLALLRAMQAAGLRFALFGSFAAWLEDAARPWPADIDLLLPAEDAAVNALLAWLQGQGFALSCWQQPLELPVRLAEYRGRYYFRAERLQRGGERLRLDLCFELDGADVAERLGGLRFCQGLPLAG